jgi:hypothetical protein
MTPMRRYLAEHELVDDLQIERRLAALRAMRTRLADAETVLLPGAAVFADPAAVPSLRDALDDVEWTGASIELDAVTGVVDDLERLLDSIAIAGLATDDAVVTLRRGIDVLTLLARDAEHQMSGAAPAALEGAVQMLREQVGRLLAGVVAPAEGLH